jgi:hypothetical protein
LGVTWVRASDEQQLKNTSTAIAGFNETSTSYELKTELQKKVITARHRMISTPYQNN